MIDFHKFHGEKVSDPAVQRDLGRHDAEIEALQSEMKQLRESLDKVSTQLATINTSIVDFKGRYKGGLWVISGIASVGGVAGAVLAWVLGLVSNLPK